MTNAGAMVLFQFNPNEQPADVQKSVSEPGTDPARARESNYARLQQQSASMIQSL
jgi:hypothetical protein